MAELFTLRIGIGPEALMPTVATAVKDLAAIGGVALDVAGRSAVRQAERSISELISEDGPRAVIAELRRRELPLSEVWESDLNRLEQLATEYDMLWRGYGPRVPWSRRSGRYAQALSFAGWPGQAPWERVLDRLVAIETTERLPSEDYRVRALSYSNPMVVEIIAAAGVAAVSLAHLLNVIVSLGSRYRREVARADAEERIQSANALDAEDLVTTRIRLRALILERVALGDIDLAPEDVTEALLLKLDGAAERLADQAPTFRQDAIDG